MVKNLLAMWESWIRSLGWEDPLEEGMATHSSILAWRIPWTLQSMGSDMNERLSLSNYDRCCFCRFLSLGSFSSVSIFILM